MFVPSLGVKTVSNNFIKGFVTVLLIQSTSFNRIEHSRFLTKTTYVVAMGQFASEDWSVEVGSHSPLSLLLESSNMGPDPLPLLT